MVLFASDAKGTPLRAGSVPRAYTTYGMQMPWLGQGAGLNGQWCEPVPGHYALGAGHRLFSAGLLRFIQPDQLSPFAGGGLNAMAYCTAEPVNQHDPTGRSVLSAAILIAAGVESLVGMASVVESWRLGPAKWRYRLTALSAITAVLPIGYTIAAPYIENTEFSHSPTALGLSLSATLTLGVEVYLLRASRQRLRSSARPVTALRYRPGDPDGVTRL